MGQYDLQQGREASSGKDSVTTLSIISGTIKDEGLHSNGATVDGDKPKFCFQVVATLVMAFVHVGIGNVYGYPGVTLPELTDRNTTELTLSINQAALFASISDLGGTLGSVIGGALLTRLGQRATLLVGLPINALAWIGVAFAQTQWLLLLMWFVLGMVTGFSAPAAGMYVLEISHKSLRGLLFGVVTTARRIGILFVFGLGSLRIGWRYIGFACSGVSLLPFVGAMLLPNSPRWLVTRGRLEEAKESLLFFRGESYDASHELKGIVDQVGQRVEIKMGFMAQLRAMLDPPTRQSLALIIFVSTLGTFSGIVVLISYTVPILQLNKADIDAYTSAILIGVTLLLGTTLHICIVDRVGRKPLLVTSFILCSFCMASLGGFFYAQSTTDVSAFGWIPLCAMMIFIFSSGVGYPVINIMQGELLPTPVRATGISLITFCVYLGSFLAAFTYPFLTDAVGQYGSFWVYSGVCLTGAAVGGFGLPETRALSLEEITKDTKQGTETQET